MDNVWTIHNPYRDVQPQSTDTWKYETECLQNTNSLMRQLDSIDIKKDKNGNPTCLYLRFTKDPDAAIFALLIQKNGFPIIEKGPGDSSMQQIHYGIKFWSGIYSLSEFWPFMKGRKVVALVPNFDYDNYDFGQKFDVSDKLTMYMCNQAILARLDGYDPSGLIICCTGGEELYEILAGYILREKGYILFPEYDFGFASMFLQMHGVPDMIAAKLGQFQSKLITQRLIDQGGWFHEIELKSVIGGYKTEDNTNYNTEISEEYVLALEIEDTAQEASSGYKQLYDYTATNYFDGGMLVCPKRHYDLEEDKNIGFGLITWNYEGKMVPKPRLECHPLLSSSHQTKKRYYLLEICKRLITNNIRKAEIKF